MYVCKRILCVVIDIYYDLCIISDNIETLFADTFYLGKFIVFGVISYIFDKTRVLFNFAELLENIDL